MKINRNENWENKNEEMKYYFLAFKIIESELFRDIEKLLFAKMIYQQKASKKTKFLIQINKNRPEFHIIK